MIRYDINNDFVPDDYRSEQMLKSSDGEWVRFEEAEGHFKAPQKTIHNKDYAKCYSEIIHIINTMVYPEASIESVLKKYFA